MCPEKMCECFEELMNEVNEIETKVDGGKLTNKEVKRNNKEESMAAMKSRGWAIKLERQN